MNDYIQHICKIGQEGRCCKYLVVGGDGFECMRKTNKEYIDHQWQITPHVAQGDNCDGLTDFYFLNTKEKMRYIILTYRGNKAILCTTCGMISHNANDVKNLWCENCKKFHDNFVPNE